LKKPLLYISISAVALYLILTTTRGMEIDEDPLEIVTVCRNYSVASYRKGREAENLWEKRKHYLHALKSSQEIAQKFPNLWTQADADQNTLIRETMRQCMNEQWMRGMRMVAILKEVPKEPS